MVSGPYKVTLPYGNVAFNLSSRFRTALHQVAIASPSYVVSLPSGNHGELETTRELLLSKVKNQLKLQDREAHLLNLYLNVHTLTFDLTGTWVFSDPDTAMLFKLSGMGKAEE